MGRQLQKHAPIISRNRDSTDLILLLGLVPTSGNNRAQQTHLATLQRIQSQSARIITGVFKATAIPTLDVEAHLLPIKHQLNKTTSEAVLDIATSPSYEEIIKPRFKRWKSRRKQRKNRLASSLKRHTKIFKERYSKTAMIEQLQTFSASPEWIPPKIVIHETKKEAKELAEATLICRSFHFLKLNITHFARSIFHFAFNSLDSNVRFTSRTDIGFIPLNTNMLSVWVVSTMKVAKPVSSVVILEALDLLPLTFYQPGHPHILLEFFGR